MHVRPRRVLLFLIAAQIGHLHVSRGLHLFTSQLNLSAFYGIGGARKDCAARVKGALGGV